MRNCPFNWAEQAASRFHWMRSRGTEAASALDASDSNHNVAVRWLTVTSGPCVCVCVCMTLSISSFFSLLWAYVPLPLPSHHQSQSCSPWLDHSRSFPWWLQSWGAVYVKNCGPRGGRVSQVWAPRLLWAPFPTAGSPPMGNRCTHTYTPFIQYFNVHHHCRTRK